MMLAEDGDNDDDDISGNLADIYRRKTDENVSQLGFPYRVTPFVRIITCDSPGTCRPRPRRRRIYQTLS